MRDVVSVIRLALAFLAAATASSTTDSSVADGVEWT
jgi:hypothetical protein